MLLALVAVAQEVQDWPQPPMVERVMVAQESIVKLLERVLCTLLAVEEEAAQEQAEQAEQILLERQSAALAAVAMVTLI